MQNQLVEKINQGGVINQNCFFLTSEEYYNVYCIGIKVKS